MKTQRLNVIREVLTGNAVTSQDDLRRKLRRRGIHVTQATLSRDMHELHLFKGPHGYSLANGNGAKAAAAAAEEDQPPTLEEMLDSFGLRVKQAMNQVVVGTQMGGAQPVAAALDREDWPEVAGTIAGDDTVLVICTDTRQASEVAARLKDDFGIMTKTVQTAVVGVTGYAGAELARLLLHHPRLHGKPPVFAGRVEGKDLARGGIPLAEIHPQLGDNSLASSLKMEPFSWELLTKLGVDVLFLATPHEQSREWVPEALKRGMRVIDLSGAWRLTNAANRAVYAFADEGAELAAATQAQAVYGMPELHRKQIAGARLIANPGCYATSIILPLRPLVAAGLVDLDHGIVADAKSGVSGAGKAPTAKTHFMYAADNLSAYGVFTHRHTGELLEQIGISSEADHLHAASAARFRAAFCPRSTCASRKRRRGRVWRKFIAIFLPAAPWSGSTKKRCRRFNTRCTPTTPTSDSNSMPTAAAPSSSVVSTTC